MAQSEEHSRPPGGRSPSEPDDLRRTVLEPVGQAGPTLPPRAPVPAAKPPVPPAAPCGPSSANALRETVRFRPVHRPPMAVLKIYDDGQESAESVRIRVTPLVIGRTEGDVCISHDPQISSRHAEIVRVAENDGFGWYLRDLGSTNGTFVRVNQAVLEHDAELMIARRRFRFDASAAEEGIPPSLPQLDGQRTLVVAAADATRPAPGRPSLVWGAPGVGGQRFVLSADSHWIGRDPQCSPSLPGDPTVDPRHARLYRDGENRWRIEDRGSRNGTWLRVEKVPLVSNDAFLLGEQVFVIVFP